MIKEKTHKVDVSLSEKVYDHKPNGAEIPLMRFKKYTLGIDDFVFEIMGGRCYASVYIKDEFSIKEKNKENFAYTNVVSLDIDHSDETMENLVDRLRYKPTFAYTSCRNGLDGQCRFRLIYCFDYNIKLDEYKRASICDSFIKWFGNRFR